MKEKNHWPCPEALEKLQIYDICLGTFQASAKSSIEQAEDFLTARVKNPGRAVELQAQGVLVAVSRNLKTPGATFPDVIYFCNTVTLLKDYNLRFFLMCINCNVKLLTKHL